MFVLRSESVLCTGNSARLHVLRRRGKHPPPPEGGQILVYCLRSTLGSQNLGMSPPPEMYRKYLRMRTSLSTKAVRYCCTQHLADFEGKVGGGGLGRRSRRTCAFWKIEFSLLSCDLPPRETKPLNVDDNRFDKSFQCFCLPGLCLVH